MSKTVNLSKNENNYFDMQVKKLETLFFLFFVPEGLYII